MSISTTIQQIESFIVTGFSVRTQNKDEFNPSSAKLPSLWEQFYNSDLAKNTHIFGVYANYESDENGFYTVTAGIECYDVPVHLSAVTVQAGHYLVFDGSGPMPQTVVDVWKQVWRFFAGNSAYQRNFISDFEAYSGLDHVTIYIGVA